jgi:hypothetical protein
MGGRKRKSKKQSDTKTPLQEQLETITFFLDRSLESKIILEELRKAGVNIEPHAMHFAPDAPDVEWLEEVGAKGWVVLMKDKNIKYNYIERKMLLSSNVKAFLFVPGNLKAVEMVAIIIKALSKIVHFVKQYDPPFLARIERDGSVKMWLDSSSS